ncbi:hypothetical protein OG21DRAFT_1449080 [Imleria badia]|nr:hypothetical protein OG21DRAFT_1449080 [Imleria badia]
MSDVSRHAYFYTDTVTFRVEDSLFKVPRDPFELESTVFRDMFLLPTGDLHREEGTSDDNPIYLEGIQKDEFEQLLGVLFHRTHGTSQRSWPETNDQWTTVLRLATLWGFDAVRQAAIDPLKEKMSPVDRVVLGQTYNLDFESWSLPAMNEIVRRQNPISLEEGRHMGLDMALKLASVREQLSFGLQRANQRTCEVVPGRRPSVETLDFKQILRKTFKTSPGLPFA